MKSRIPKRVPLWGLPAIVVAALALGLGTVLGANPSAGNLPTGTAIDVEITAPGDASEHWEGDDVGVTGTASIAEGATIKNTGIVYVIDASGSTASSSGGTTCGSQQTTDPEDAGVANQIIDCEILAVINLNNVAVANGTVGEVAMVAFAGGANTADMTPGGADIPIIDPGADGNTNTRNDVDEVAEAIWVAEFGGEVGKFDEFTDKTWNLSGTNYEPAANAACAAAASMTSATKLVIFASDGQPNAGNAANAVPCGSVVFHTFAVGASASCGSGGNSLQGIADATGGTCTAVPDPNNLPAVVPGVVASQLTKIELTVDGGAPIDVSASASPGLPVTGPGSTSWSHTLSGLLPGSHTICATSFGTDAGGAGDSGPACITIEVVQHLNIDIKPGSDPNSIKLPRNLRSKAVIPVAVLGSASFDVTSIDVTTLMAFSDMGAAPDGNPPSHDLTDAAVYAEHLQDVNSDGFTDLVMHFPVVDGGIDAGDTEACVRGELSSGVLFEGCDAVRTDIDP